MKLERIKKTTKISKDWKRMFCLASKLHNSRERKNYVKNVEMIFFHIA